MFLKIPDMFLTKSILDGQKGMCNVHFICILGQGSGFRRYIIYVGKFGRKIGDWCQKSKITTKSYFRCLQTYFIITLE